MNSYIGKQIDSSIHFISRKYVDDINLRGAITVSHIATLKLAET